MSLWHGTSGTDPMVIINGEEGFDIKYSQAGKWGKGLYFAKMASYSNKFFCSKHEDAVKGMFLAKVLTGKVENLPSDKKLKGPSADFDSVQGFTGPKSSAEVFIVYANKKAYPQYFIKYTN